MTSIEQSRRNLEQTRRNLEQTRRNIQQSRKGLENTQQSIKRLEQRREQNRRDLEQNRRNIQQGRKRLEQSRRETQQSRKGLENLQQSIKRLEQSRKQSRRNLQQSRKRLEQSRKQNAAQTHKQAYYRDIARSPFQSKADKLLYNYSPHKHSSPIQRVDQLPGGKSRIFYTNGNEQVINKSALDRLVDRADLAQRDALTRKVKQLEANTRINPPSAEPGIRVMHGADGSLTFKRMLPQAFQRRLLKSGNATVPYSGLIKPGTRADKWLSKSPAGRRARSYLNDPETKQFAKDLAVLGGLTILSYKAFPIARRWMNRVRYKGDAAQIMYEAQNPTSWQVFKRVFGARKSRKQGFFKGLSEAWKAAAKNVQKPYTPPVVAAPPKVTPPVVAAPPKVKPWPL